MKKLLLSVIGAFLLLAVLIPIANAGDWSTWNYLQKQKFTTCWKDNCYTKLLNKQWQEYMSCSLSCKAEADNYNSNQSTCKDSDAGIDYLTKGTVTTDLAVKDDYCYTFPNGKEYLMEGACSASNKYIRYQKNCKELGMKYSCQAGACVYVNHAPVFEPIGDKEVNEGEPLSFEVTATDKDGDVLTLSAEGLLEGVKFESGVFTWIPGYEQAGGYEVTFYVSDGDLVDKEVVKILVIDVEVCQWINSYGGVAVDGLTDVLYDSNGGYVSTGYFSDVSDGNGKIVLMKVDDTGVEQWTKLFLGGNGTEGQALVETNDGGYVIAGDTLDEGTSFRSPVLIKTDENGNEQWIHYYGGKKDYFIWDIVQTKDGGYVSVGETNSVAQSTSSDLWVVKVDSAGGIEWQKTYGDVEHEVGYSIQQSDDGDYVIAGSYQKPGSQTNDLYLLKLDNNGDKEWEKIVGGEYSDIARSVRITSDGGYIVAGYTHFGYEPYDRDAWLIKFDSNGNIMWDSNFDGGGDDIAFSVVEPQDGGYVITGKTTLDNGQEAILLLKTDSDGNEEWKKVFNEGTSSTGLSIDTVDGTGYIIGGAVDIPGKSREMLLIKTDSLGSVGLDGCL